MFWDWDCQSAWLFWLACKFVDPQITVHFRGWHLNKDCVGPLGLGWVGVGGSLLWSWNRLSLPRNARHLIWQTFMMFQLPVRICGGLGDRSLLARARTPTGLFCSSQTSRVGLGCLGRMSDSLALRACVQMLWPNEQVLSFLQQLDWNKTIAEFCSL